MLEIQLNNKGKCDCLRKLYTPVGKITKEMVLTMALLMIKLVKYFLIESVILK